TVVLYDRLFTEENMNDVDSADYDQYLSPTSAVRVEHVMIEEALAEAAPGDKFQFVRDGYYCRDTKNENTFNRVVTLKDSFKA
ncbi:MAG: glutamine--tRNA ligase, partial [Clostridia bacterium]|nr:glutamine--tRNA ligase [Clostridia bacterium]